MVTVHDCFPPDYEDRRIPVPPAPAPDVSPENVKALADRFGSQLQDYLDRQHD